MYLNVTHHIAVRLLYIQKGVLRREAIYYNNINYSILVVIFFLYFYKAYTKYLLAWTNEAVLSTGQKGLALHRLGSCYWQSIPYSRANLSPHCFASDPVFSNAPRKATQNCPSTWPPSHQHRRPGWHSGLLVLVWARSGCCSHLEMEPVDGQFSLFDSHCYYVFQIKG